MKKLNEKLECKKFKMKTIGTMLHLVNQAYLYQSWTSNLLLDYQNKFDTMLTRINTDLLD